MSGASGREQDTQMGVKKSRSSQAKRRLEGDRTAERTIRV
jgi:hypothetical protein